MILVWATTKPGTGSVEQFTPASMQAVLGSVSGRSSRPRRHLFVQDAANSTWWNVSLDEGATLAFLRRRPRGTRQAAFLWWIRGPALQGARAMTYHGFERTIKNIRMTC